MTQWYITKYALTEGIIEVSDENGEWYIWDGKYLSQTKGHVFFKIGGDVFGSLKDARDRAERERVRKIKSLRDKISKLELMTIKVKK